MRRALDLAAQAGEAGEVPIAAVVTRGGRIIAEAANAMRSGRNPTAHAEMEVIRAACAALDQERLEECELWVTLEPCAMCAGAIALARIGKLYYAASDPKGGAVEHGGRFFGQPTCHHRPDVYSGLGEREAVNLLKKFFADRR